MSNVSSDELAPGFKYGVEFSESFPGLAVDFESVPDSMVLLEEEASGGLYSRRGPSTGLRDSAIASS